MVYHASNDPDWRNSKIFCDETEIDLDLLIVADDEAGIVVRYAQDRKRIKVIYGKVTVKTRKGDR